MARRLKSLKINFRIGPISGETRIVMPRTGYDGIRQSPYSRKTEVEQVSETLEAWKGEVRGLMFGKDLPPSLVIDDELASILSELRGYPKAVKIKRGGEYIYLSADEARARGLIYAPTIDNYFGGGTSGLEIRGRAVAMLIRLLHGALRNPYVPETLKSRIRTVLQRLGILQVTATAGAGGGAAGGKATRRGRRA